MEIDEKLCLPEALTQEQEERFRKANRHLEEMEEKIKPYVIRRTLKEYSTAGKWVMDTPTVQL